MARAVHWAALMKAPFVDFSPCASAHASVGSPPERDPVANALREALGLSLQLTTVLAASEMDPLASNVGLRLARAHSLSVVDQLTDLLRHQQNRR